ncbi:hypothetical protein B0F90DRAFT_1283807 [Multifurca ochricompacta]|uniref:Uncharacterized protein n=1 Tax=Multifurca ochricompacta TaxID=376703 RepID=A0AAD4LZY4_9AGAM|nr:hypothetical protein B0F90DRAFT_1283807 [Multifurca ochricompacta]
MVQQIPSIIKREKKKKGEGRRSSNDYVDHREEASIIDRWMIQVNNSPTSLSVTHRKKKDNSLSFVERALTCHVMFTLLLPWHFRKNIEGGGGTIPPRSITEIIETWHTSVSTSFFFFRGGWWWWLGWLRFPGWDWVCMAYHLISRIIGVRVLPSSIATRRQDVCARVSACWSFFDLETIERERGW